jgi:hypothetical protein
VVKHSARPRLWLFAVSIAGLAACNSLLGNEDPSWIGAGGQAGLEGGDGGQAPGANGGGNASGGRANQSGGAASLTGGAGGDAAEAGASATGGEVTSGGAPMQAEGGSAGALPPGSEAPTVVSLTPADDAVAVEPTATIEITFSEAMDGDSVRSGISVSDGVNEIEGTIDVNGESAVFTPTTAFSLLATYTVSVAAGVTDAEGTPLAATVEAAFTIRDGVWGPEVTLTNDSGTIVPVTQFPARPVIDGAGNALVVWSQEDTSDGVQSIWARTYSARGAWGTAFLVDESPFDCRAANVAMNSAGEALIVWSEAQAADGSSHRVMARRYVGGELEAAPRPVDGAAGSIPSELIAAVSERGDFHVFWARPPTAAPALTYVYHSLAGESGPWTADAAEVSTNFVAVYALDAAFDAGGDGFVAWAGTRVAQSEIAVRRYGAAGSFAAEIIITGSPGASGLALALDADDNAVIAWSDTTDVKASSFSPAESWSEAQPIEARTGSPVEDSVTIDVAGSTFLVGYGQTAMPIENAYVSSFDGTAWNGSTLVSDGSNRVSLDSRVTVGGDAHGNALAVFVVQPTSDDGPNRQHVSYVRLPNGASDWSAPVAISSVAPYDRASLDVAENGSAIALWQTDDASYALHAAIFE